MKQLVLLLFLISACSTQKELHDENNLDRETIRVAVGKYAVKFKKCYEMELKINPQTGGQMTVEFEVAKSGRVLSSKVVSSTVGELQSGKMKTCILGVLQNIEFPKLQAEKVIVTYPFIFREKVD